MKDLQPGFSIVHLLVVFVFMSLLESGLVGDQFLPILETRTGVYSNVTVTLKTARDVHIRHDGGIGNIELEDLDDETKVSLGYQAGAVETQESDGAVDVLHGGWMRALERARARSGAEGQVPIAMPVVLSPAVIAGVFFGALLFHLFFSYCSRLICIKAGGDPGVLVWLPVLQILPMFKAAGMSGWWFLGLFVPVLNLVVQVLWSIKIVSARGKHFVWAILLVLPFINIIAFLYLAFSGDGSSNEPVAMGTFSPRPI